MGEERLRGIFSATKNGYGFVRIDDGLKDVFIPSDYTFGAFDGDEVLIIIDSVFEDGKREGKVLKIVNRAISTLVGTFDESKNFAFLVPDNQKINQDIFIDKKHFNGARNNDKVEVKLLDYGSKNKSPEGKVIEVIGNVNKPGVDIYSIAKSYNLRMDFPVEVLEEAKRVSRKSISDEINDRKDLRDLFTITIDGEDAKDLDDAITVQNDKDGYTLGVHIADVTHYVSENSKLDKEAFTRGTSVYLPDRVIPMLPKELSNGVCSLNEGEDRLTLSCIVQLDFEGNIKGSEIVKSVICVNERCSYNQVQKIFDDGQENNNNELSNMLFNAKKLSNILRTKRMKRGLVDFDFPEAKIILNKRGKAVRIDPYLRNDATMLIEDFMLLANETVAETYYWMETPFLYRTHEAPDPEKIQKLSVLLASLGYYLKGNNEIHPKELQKLINKIHGEPEEAFVSRFILRSMKQARYTVECTGHFGLAAKYYTHFTSPIRRYPDLQIHRIIKESLSNSLNNKRQEHYDYILPDVAMHSSLTERTAQETERECDKLKKAEYMKSHIGEEFTGIISSTTNWGMYVELENTIEGLIRLAYMNDDFYDFNESTMEIIGERTGKTYKIGQMVKVKATNCDLLNRTIDFMLCE